MKTARAMIDGRIAELVAKELHTLVPPLRALREVLGGIELTPETEQTLEWLLHWDHSIISGVAALVRDARRSV